MNMWALYTWRGVKELHTPHTTALTYMAGVKPKEPGQARLHSTSESSSKSTGLVHLCPHTMQPPKKLKPWSGCGAYRLQDALVAARLKLFNQRGITKDTHLLARGDLQLLFDVVCCGKRRAEDRVLRGAATAKCWSNDVDSRCAERGKGTMEAAKPWSARRFTMFFRETLPSTETQRSRFPWPCMWRSVSIERATSASGSNTSARQLFTDSRAPSKVCGYIRSNATMRLVALVILLCQAGKRV